MPKSAGYVNPEYLKMIANIAREFKNASFNKMNLKKGDVALDMGCGPASDTIEMGKITTQSGKVYGIDMDEEMVCIGEEESRKQEMSAYVFHRTGSVEALDFEDNVFDSVRAERLFQVLPLTVNRDTILNEVMRVLKPGGIFLALDTDWATASVDFPDTNLERKLMNWFALKFRPDGMAGRKFLKLFKDAGFQNIKLETNVFTHKSLNETPFGEPFVKMAQADRVITEEEGRLWLKTLKEKGEHGTYYSGVNFITVYGEKKG